MYFRSIYPVLDMMLVLEEDDLRFECGGPHNIAIIMSANAQRWGVTPDGNRHICVAVADTEPPKKAAANLEAIAQGSDTIDGPLREFAGQIGRELTSTAQRTLKLLRWRYDLDGHHTPFVGTFGMHWSPDGSRWLPLRTPLTIKLGMAMGAILGRVETRRDEVVRLFQAGDNEPIYRMIFLEGWEQRHENPRSALIIGMAAAEIGVKSFVCDVAPAARWFLEKQQAPPLVSILQGYLPEVVEERYRSKLPPESMIEELKKAVLLRNEATHQAGKAPDWEVVERSLLVVRDMLCLLDYYRGYEWALENVREEVLKAMEKP